MQDSVIQSVPLDQFDLLIANMRWIRTGSWDKHIVVNRGPLFATRDNIARRQHHDSPARGPIMRTIHG